jgi:hypothetical protein
MEPMKRGDKEPSGFILTTILGIVGAFVATFIGQAVGWYGPNEGGDEGADDAEDRRQDEAGRLLVTGHDELGDDAGHEADDDGPEKSRISQGNRRRRSRVCHPNTAKSSGRSFRSTTTFGVGTMMMVQRISMSSQPRKSSSI